MLLPLFRHSFIFTTLITPCRHAMRDVFRAAPRYALTPRVIIAADDAYAALLLRRSYDAT